MNKWFDLSVSSDGLVYQDGAQITDDDLLESLRDWDIHKFNFPPVKLSDTYPKSNAYVKYTKEIKDNVYAYKYDAAYNAMAEIIAYDYIRYRGGKLEDRRKIEQSARRFLEDDLLDVFADCID